MWCVLHKPYHRIGRRVLARSNNDSPKQRSRKRRMLTCVLLSFAVLIELHSLVHAAPPFPSLNRGGSYGSRGGSSGLRFRLGPTYLSLSHAQSNTSSVTYTALAPDLTATWGITQHSFIEAGGYYTVSELSNSSSSTVTYWSAAGRWMFPFARGKRVSWYLGPGLFYRTMSVSQLAFGFQDVSGPELSTHFDVMFKRKQRILFGGRYGLVSTGTLTAGRSRELGGFVRFGLPVKRGRNHFWFQFEYTKTSLVLPTASQLEVTLNSNLMRFSILFGK